MPLQVREVMKKFGEVLDDDSLQSMIDEVNSMTASMSMQNKAILPDCD